MADETLQTPSIQELPESQAPVLGFRINGKVSADEEQAWIARFEQALAEYPWLDALVMLGPEAGWTLQAGMADIKWLTGHRDRIRRIAVVSDSTLWAALVALDRPFANLAGVEERHFQRDEMDAAWSWLRR